MDEDYGVLVYNAKTGERRMRDLTKEEKVERKKMRAEIQAEETEQTLKAEYKAEKKLVEDYDYKNWKNDKTKKKGSKTDG